MTRSDEPEPVPPQPIAASASSSRRHRVIAEGRYEVVVDDGARRAARSHLSRGDGGPVTRVPDAARGTVVFRLRLSAETGRFERRDA